MNRDGVQLDMDVFALSEGRGTVLWDRYWGDSISLMDSEEVWVSFLGTNSSDSLSLGRLYCLSLKEK